MEFGMLLRLVGLMNLFSFNLVWSVFKGEDPAEVISSKELTVGWYADICRPISLKLGRMIDSTKVYLL